MEQLVTSNFLGMNEGRSISCLRYPEHEVRLYLLSRLLIETELDSPAHIFVLKCIVEAVYFI